MTNRYDSFEMFMIDVVKKAEAIHKLDSLFDISEREIIDYSLKLISKGWFVFLAVCSLLIMGPLGFLGALMAFLATPIGLIVAAALGVGAYQVLKSMYKNRSLPIAVKEVGNEYKSRWTNAEHDHLKIDALLKEAVSDLFHKSKHSLPVSVISALKHLGDSN